VNDAARAAGLRAGPLVRQASGVLGGGGGGKDDIAQGGGPRADAVPEALVGLERAVRDRA
ncbi:MAG: DHHA1 domain-containing protein, partial [Mycobacteriales bacterium]